MYLRKRRRYWREIPESASGDDAQERTTQLARASTPATALSDLDCREQLEHTRQIVERLGERYPEVFWRRYGQGFTETEIAADLGLSLATVKTRAHRAKLAVAAGAQQRAAA
jgi:RNA polymerase sigma factor (sigma-70 family)